MPYDYSPSVVLIGYSELRFVLEGLIPYGDDTLFHLHLDIGVLFLIDQFDKSPAELFRFCKFFVFYVVGHAGTRKVDAPYVSVK